MTGPQDQPIDWLIYEKLVSMRIHADYWVSKPVGAEALFNLSDDLELIAQYIHQVDSLGWADLGIEAHLVHARLRLAMNQEKEALESLASALQLGEARGYVQVYLDEGKVIVPLLYQLAANGILPEFVGKLLAIFSADDSKARPEQRDHLIEPLTSREIDVLRAIAAGLSNQEIGQHLAISVGTVKRHTANINRKLDVHSRLQAVMRARRLGILKEN